MVREKEKDGYTNTLLAISESVVGIIAGGY
jgi:hypothetical protein